MHHPSPINGLSRCLYLDCLSLLLISFNSLVALIVFVVETAISRLTRLRTAICFESAEVLKMTSHYYLRRVEMRTPRTTPRRSIPIRPVQNRLRDARAGLLELVPDDKRVEFDRILTDYDDAKSSELIHSIFNMLNEIAENTRELRNDVANNQRLEDENNALNDKHDQLKRIIDRMLDLSLETRSILNESS
jgi:hypothetical protein